MCVSAECLSGHHFGYVVEEEEAAGAEAVVVNTAIYRFKLQVCFIISVFHSPVAV